MTVGDHNVLYCGRKLGVDKIPGSDGQCGPNNGPQCQACKNTGLLYNSDGIKMTKGKGNTLYCGRRLG